MLRSRVLSLTKTPWVLTMLPPERSFFHGSTRIPRLVTPYFALPPMREAHVAPTSFSAAEETKKSMRAWTKILTLGGLINVNKYKRKFIGYSLYEDITYNIDYKGFFTDFRLQDTFYSWFAVMELHLWMLMVRYMEEGKKGQEIRNSIVEAMWADMNTRKGKLEGANLIALKKQAAELSKQFNAAIIGYDEGLMSDDKVLAGALWRRLFQCDGNNPEHLEQLVLYVRKQMHELEKIPGEELLWKTKTQWLDYRNP